MSYLSQRAAPKQYGRRRRGIPRGGRRRGVPRGGAADAGRASARRGDGPGDVDVERRGELALRPGLVGPGRERPGRGGQVHQRQGVGRDGARGHVDAAARGLRPRELPELPAQVGPGQGRRPRRGARGAARARAGRARRARGARRLRGDLRAEARAPAGADGRARPLRVRARGARGPRRLGRPRGAARRRLLLPAPPRGLLPRRRRGVRPLPRLPRGLGRETRRRGAAGHAPGAAHRRGGRAGGARGLPAGDARPPDPPALPGARARPASFLRAFRTADAARRRSAPSTTRTRTRSATARPRTRRAT